MSEQLAQLEKKGGGSSGGLLVRNPVLTSDTGQVSQSSYTAGVQGWKAFTGDTTDRWAPAQGAESNAWVSFHFSEKLHPKMANIMTRYDGSPSSCGNLVFECSNDGTSWVQIASSYNVFNGGVTKVHQLLVTEKASAYAYFRVRGSFSYSGNGFKMQFFGEK